MLFSERSIWTMIHGIALGGGALLALGAALFAMFLMRDGAPEGPAGGLDPSWAVAMLGSFTALSLWLTVLVGTYRVFPPYRATPPEGTTELSEYPRSFLLADPEIAWLHTFAMETKEHLPFIAAMLATAFAFIAWRYRAELFSDAHLRRIGNLFLGISFAIVSYVSLLGMFVNKVAPLD